MTRRGGRGALKKQSGIGEDETAGDAATSRSMKAFQYGNIGNA